MKRKWTYTSLFKWLNSTELFLQPSKHLPGKWKLFEFYTEPDGNLINMKEEEIKNKKLYWDIKFCEHGQLEQETNLPVKFLKGGSDCEWQLARNFIYWFHVDDSKNKEKFQYAIVNEILKLLNKDQDGKIKFFGFFRRVDEGC